MNDIHGLRALFTNENWSSNLWSFLWSFLTLGSNLRSYNELLCTTFAIDPIRGQIASNRKSIFDPEKAAAMYFWYKKADSSDYSIIKYFPEYERCVNAGHPLFNSNYGVYASRGLEHCINILSINMSSRHACFMINNNKAMGPDSIDKLCTNAVMFIIRDNKLNMIVQMRSSNLLTLLPYDAFIFCTWYAKVYNALVRIYPDLKMTEIRLQIASLHFYESDYNKKLNSEILEPYRIFYKEDVIDHNFEILLERKLLNYLTDK